jgi:excisionase family DNA binding protein
MASTVVVDPAEVAGLLTSREAGELIGRSTDAVRGAIAHGSLPAIKTWDGWRVRREDVVAWATAGRPKPNFRRPRYEDAAEVLDEFGSISVDELAALWQVHPGNARKALAILGAQGRAHRDEQGQWYPGSAHMTTGSSEAGHRKTA